MSQQQLISQVFGIKSHVQTSSKSLTTSKAASIDWILSVVAIKLVGSIGRVVIPLVSFVWAVDNATKQSDKNKNDAVFKYTREVEISTNSMVEGN